MLSAEHLPGVQSSRGRQLARDLIDFLLPPVCAVCRRQVPADSRHSAFCPTCELQLSPVPVNRCRACGAEAGPFAKSDDGCRQCRGKGLRFDSVTCLGMYESHLKTAILGAKWAYSAVRINSLGRLLASARRTELATLNVEVILPIPDHWRRRIWKRFNAAGLIAFEVAAGLGVRCEWRDLARARPTRQQKRVAHSHRFENQRGSFRLMNAAAYRGRRVLLVDDVVTTGATCSEASRLLKEAGCLEVHVAALARVSD